MISFAGNKYECMPEFYFLGPLMGALSFVTIGIFHPVVAKLEYYYGKQSWWVLFFPGLFFIVLSLFLSDLASIALGVLGFSMLWSTHELFKQHNRVLKGQAKRNPNRKYKSL